MLHPRTSPTEARGSIPGNTNLALVAVAALLLSAGCGLDSPNPLGPGGQSDQLNAEDPNLFPTETIRRRPRPSATANVAAVHPGLAGLAGGATQISGIGYYPEADECMDTEGQGSDYPLILTGDLDGCVYVFVESARCTAGGVYIETGTETFVGSHNGVPGTFRTTYLYTATFTDCANLAGQTSGRCQHPLIAGSGTGAFAGLTGRLDMTDDVVAGNFPYRGHFRS